ncbi:hypothetical protein H0X10_01275 [Candidatus Saccharibacteria bacterium]|nr:hypothetical protein [Candidatus Saccharibacteria bacterium]
MNEKVAQVTGTPNNGGSNARDFQPTTRNPQTTPVNLFQQQTGVQNNTNTQELLSDQSNVRITVTKDPAPAQVAQVMPTKDATGLIVLSVVAILVAIALFKFSNKLPTKRKTISELPVQSKAVETENAAVTTVESAAKTKKKPKKKSSKRKRR